MPDLTPVTYAKCPTAESFVAFIPSASEPGKTYRIEFNPRRGFTESEGWRCADTETHQPCKGFQYRKRCRHVERAKRKWCGWDQFIDSGEPTQVLRVNGEVLNTCPNCHKREVIYEEHLV